MRLNKQERQVILAALFELWLTRSTFHDDPHADHIPIARISNESIEALVAKFGGDPATALFGAFGDQWADVYEARVPEYLADETNEA